MSETAYLEGIISVEAAIRAGSRPVYRLCLLPRKRDRRVQRLRQTAVAHQIAVQEVDDAFIAAHATGKSHGGVLAEVGTRRFVALSALVVGERPFVMMLDGIEDPFNFGLAIRALYAAGVTGLVVRPRNWLSAAGVVTRASAGASEWMPMAVAESAEAAAAYFKQKGLRVACTTKKKAVSLYVADLRQPIFLLIGGERRGITRSFLQMADMRLEVPYGQPFAHSLGTATAASVIAFEVMRQRMEHE